MIRLAVGSFQSFSFHHITIQEIFGQLIKLDPREVTTQETIPQKYFK